MSFSPRALHGAALLIFTGAVAVTAGCSTNSSTPPTPSPTATPTPSPSPTGSAAPVFTFTNAGGTANITGGASGGGTLTSGAAVGGVSASSTWGPNNATTTIAMTAQLATGSGDITTNSIAFPLFTVASAVDTNGNALTGSYTAVDYLKITATPETIFAQTPAIVVTVGAPASIAGKVSCSYFTLGGSVSSPKWQQVLTAAPSGNTVTFAAQTLPAGSTVDVGNGSTNVAYLALACK